jgi:alpha-glucoside transport system substrate-binding protein
VRQAFERLGQVLFTEGYVADGAIEASFDSAQDPMVKRDPPACWLYQFPSFAANFVPPGSVGRTTDVFPFPSLRADAPGVVGAGDQIGVFSDRPEVREVVRYMLGPQYGTELTGRMEFISPNRGFDLSNYEPFERRQAELIQTALAADAFRFDASDLMPPPIGNDLFWAAMMRYAAEGPESLDAILTELDAAWPDDG